MNTLYNKTYSIKSRKFLIKRFGEKENEMEPEWKEKERNATLKNQK